MPSNNWISDHEKLKKELGVKDNDAIWDIAKLLKYPVDEMERLQETIHTDVEKTTGIVKNSLIIGISAGMILLCLVGGTMGYLGYHLGYDNGHTKGQKGEYDVAYSSGFKAGYTGGMDNSLPPKVIRSPEEDAKNEFKNKVRMCVSSSGNRVGIAPIAKGKGGEKLACFPAEGDGWWLE